ncbi:hypothetical protein Lgra_2388 [Legionella gratiana]|uniref:Transmembrane protein n=1 Tax=Legionella gratiana TaxID=45066 RepID=A0A378JCU6_9GAMM|nr:hypothetical protein [Legionella gratiana]KTD09153.1 hypothetical protein Lgra_2388 [Legionella gratiana]STX45633.1 Uncharacterised protein [Legionella gratiana]
MNIENRFLFILNLFKNPNLYVAAAVGSIPGGATGGAIGALSGAFITPLFGLFTGYKDLQFGIDINLIVGAAFGFIIGMFLGGALTGSIAIFKIYKNKNEIEVLSKDNISDIFLPALGISVELSIGMAIGAVIGSLKLLGIGTAVGAVIGTALILISTEIIKINEKRKVKKH